MKDRVQLVGMIGASVVDAWYVPELSQDIIDLDNGYRLRYTKGGNLPASFMSKDADAEFWGNRGPDDYE